MCAEKDYKESHHYYEGCGEEGPIRCANHHNFQCYLHRHETKRYVFEIKGVWENTLSAGTIDPFEGENVLSWKTNGAGWFGAGIQSVQPINLSQFSDGTSQYFPIHVIFLKLVVDRAYRRKKSSKMPMTFCLGP